MPYNGSGTYSLPSGNPVVANTTASSTTRNSTFNDVATALTNALTKDGQSTPTANITLGGYRLTNVGDATSLQDAVTALQIQNNGLTILSSVSGADTITASLTPTPSAYAAGQIFALVPAANNTGAATINVSSLGAKSIFLNGAALVADALVSGEVVIVRYNGTEFDIIGGHDIAKLGASSNTFSGGMGLGITPSSKLHVKQSAASSGLIIESNVNDERLLAHYNSTNNEHVISATYNTTGAYRDISFFTSDTKRMTLTQGGHLKVSNNGAYLGAGASFHEFNNNAATATLVVNNTSASSAVNNYNSQLPSGAAGKHAQFDTNGVRVFNVLFNGNVQNTNNSYGAISDRKLKKIIKQIEPSKYYERFKQIGFWIYTLKSDETNKKQLGVIAQEIEKVFPGLVTWTPDTRQITKTRDIDGVVEEYTEFEETGEKTASVNYSILNLIASTIVQQLQKEVESLRADMDGLKFALEAVRVRVEAVEAKK
jgi:hypothetical protein